MNDDRPLHWAEWVSAEMSAAATRYGQFASSHEALGVLTEEYAELLEAIRANDMRAIRQEAVQIAAVAIRLRLACDETAFVERSGK